MFKGIPVSTTGLALLGMASIPINKVNKVLAYMIQLRYSFQTFLIIYIQLKNQPNLHFIRI